MRIATWNVNSLKARQPRVEEWLSEFEPEVLCLQETKLSDAKFPAKRFEALGYESVHHGQGQWNGVAILSRVGIADPHAGFEDDQPPDEEARLVSATCGGVRISSVYVPNGRTLDDDHYRYKLEWLARLRTMLETNHDPHERLAILGDYNIAPEDNDVWDIKAFDGSTHVSRPERDAFDGLKAWGLHDLFRQRFSDDGLYTYWDYRDGNFHKKKGMRIDHILATEPLRDAMEFVFIDRNARKGTKPSDHTTLIAAFAGV